MNECLDMKLIPKIWGFEKIITNSSKYCGKILYIVKGHKTSLHYHKNKDETFYVQNGRVTIYYVDNHKGSEIENMVKSCDIKTFIAKLYGGADMVKKVILKRGDSFHVKPGIAHQIFANEDGELFEFSTQHFDQDSHRILHGE